jgi:hypothetical protein
VRAVPIPGRVDNERSVGWADPSRRLAGGYYFGRDASGRGQSRRILNRDTCNEQPVNAALWFVDPAMMDGVKRQFQAVRYAKLVKNVVQMVFDGLLADQEF